MDMLALQPNEDREVSYPMLIGWMIYGKMDDLALKLLAEYYEIEANDIEDWGFIEALMTTEDTKEDIENRPAEILTPLAVLKYNRLKALLVQRYHDNLAWMSFLMGTHTSAGAHSLVMQIRGKFPVIAKIRMYAFERDVEKRVSKLTTEIEMILAFLKGRN